MGRIIARFFQIIFVALIVVGIIGIIIPFDFKNFSYSTNISNNSISINNKSNKTYNYVEISVEYTLYSRRGIAQNQREFKFNIREVKDNSTYYNALPTSAEYPTIKIHSVKIKTEDKAFEIYENPYFSSANWSYISLIIIGFFGASITTAIKKSKQKEQEQEIKNQKTFQDKVREAFTPVMDTINTVKKTYEDSARKINEDNSQKTSEEKPRKLTCPYCKGKYSSNDDKCPHCGAPPEPYN